MQRTLSACRPGTPEWGLLGVPPLLLVLRGQKRVSKWGSVVNNGENIASEGQSLGMRPWNLRPCGRQWTPCVCRQERPVYGLLSVPLLVWAIWGQNGPRSWGV